MNNKLYPILFTFGIVIFFLYSVRGQGELKPRIDYNWSVSIKVYGKHKLRLREGTIELFKLVDTFIADGRPYLVICETILEFRLSLFDSNLVGDGILSYRFRKLESNDFVYQIRREINYTHCYQKFKYECYIKLRNELDILTRRAMVNVGCHIPKKHPSIFHLQILTLCLCILGTVILATMVTVLLFTYDTSKQHAVVSSGF